MIRQALYVTAWWLLACGALIVTDAISRRIHNRRKPRKGNGHES